MSFIRFLSVLGVFLLLFVVGCSNETAIDNTTSTIPNGPEVGLAAPDNGGVKVDSSTSCDSDTEDNSICSNAASAVIWLRTVNFLGSGAYTATVCWLDAQGKQQCSAAVSFSDNFQSACFPTYYWATFDPPSTLGTYKLILKRDSNGTKVGSDSFQVEPTSTCNNTN